MGFPVESSGKTSHFAVSARKKGETNSLVFSVAVKMSQKLKSGKRKSARLTEAMAEARLANWPEST